jgi:Tfp pilus assembly protein FimT
MFKAENSPGFSLIETIMILAILGLVLSFGWYAFSRIIPKYRLEGAVNSLVSDFQLARMRAIGQNCYYRIQVDCGLKHYLLERESLTGPSRWPGIPDGVTRKFNDPRNPYYYPGVDLASSSNNPIFLPRGNVVGTTIVLKNSSGQKTITLSSQGRVKVQEG